MRTHPRIRYLEEMFDRALAGGYDGDKPWAAVRYLHNHGSRFIFDKAARWTLSAKSAKRSRAADILCQLRAPKTRDQKLSRKFADPIFVDESLNLILRMIECETDEDALISELYALGHLYRVEAVPVIIRFAQHSNEIVRYAVTHALGQFPQERAAVESLIQLSSDADSDIRNWATFTIGTQSDIDTPEIREALVARLSDSSSVVREEGIAGLAKRKDTRAVLPLFKLMRKTGYFIHHKQDFEELVGQERRGEERWGTEDFIDALYAKFPDLLPPRE